MNLPHPLQSFRSLARVASAPPVPQPGESLPAATAPLTAGTVAAGPVRRRRDAPLRRSLRASLAEGAVAEVFGAWAGGAVLTGWALYLGATPFIFGVLGAVPLASQVLHLPAAWLTHALGRKTVAVTAVGASRLIWLAVVALPFLPLSGDVKLALFLGVVGAGAVLAVVGNNAWTAWMGDLVPAPIRGRFFGRRTVYLALAGTLASLGAGMALDALGPRGWRGETFAGLAAAACVAGVASVVLLRRQHDPGPPAGGGRPEWRSFGAFLRDPGARPFLWYQFGWNAAIAPAASFFSFHMLANLKVGFALAAAHGVGIAVARILSAPVWGRAVDRFGARPVLTVCSFGLALVPALWLLPTPERIWPIAVEAIVAGLFWGGHGIAALDLAIELSPGRERQFYLAAFATAGGLGFALASTLAGLLAEWLPEAVHFLGSHRTPMHVLFVVSAVSRAVAALLARRIEEPRTRSVRELLASLVRGVPQPSAGGEAGR